MVDPKWSCADGRSKEISCCSPKDILIPLPRIPFSLLWRATGLLRPRSSDILPLLSFVRPILPRPSWAGAVSTLRLLGVPGCAIDSLTLFLCCYDVTESLAAPLILRHDERNTGAKKMAAPLILRHRKLHLGANSLVFTMWSGGASLHRVEEHLSGLWGRFLHVSFSRPSHAVSPRPGLVKLLALSNFPAYVQSWTVFHRTLRPVLFCIFGCSLSSVLPSPWSNAPLVTGISNPMASLRRSSFYVHHWWRESGMDLSSLTHSSEDSFAFEFVWLIRSLFWPMIVNVFVAFHKRGIVLFALL